MIGSYAIIGGQQINSPAVTVAGSMFIFIGLLATIVILVAVGRRRRIPRPGLCSSCSYNLTGNVSGICPECGKAIESEVRDPKPAEGRLE